jgi:DNA repair exonuclease SbcCD nuclease subunit
MNIKVNTNIIVIGDNHIKINNIQDVDLFIDKLILELNNRKDNIDFIVCLGDILDTHERIHVTPLNKAYEFFNKLRNIKKTFVLIGNHDYQSNTEFLSNNHWMNALKLWDNLTIVDKVHLEVINNQLFTFVPYVFPGRFEEALNTYNTTSSNILDWKNSTCIFAHQEFKGCKMGCIISTDGDTWPENYPNVISGHIHSKQNINNNIYYTGSAMQIAFGESETNTIAYVSFPSNYISNEKYELEEINLNLPRKKIVYLDIDEVEDYKLNEDTNQENLDKIKITVSGVYDQFKSFKKTTKYKKLIEKGIKITFKPKKIKDENTNEENNDNKLDVQKNINDEISETNNKFLLILSDMVNNQNNILVKDTYKTIMKL